MYSLVLVFFFLGLIVFFWKIDGMKEIYLYSLLLLPDSSKSLTSSYSIRALYHWHPLSSRYLFESLNLGLLAVYCDFSPDRMDPVE